IPETNTSKRKYVFSVVSIDIAVVRSDPQSRDVTNVPVLDTSKKVSENWITSSQLYQPLLDLLNAQKEKTHASFRYVDQQLGNRYKMVCEP
ncbi:hypothetical protein NAI30_09860, partial [Francisella tularensis subsp. holarctica]|nr:hypothetical protein [Francisella tularensis subsp. holarctica]